MANNDLIAATTHLKQESSPPIARRAEVVLIAAIATLHLVLLRPWFLLARPYWHDEAWVAIADRAPLSQLALTTGTTPIGWTFLMSVLPGTGDQYQRLLPLAFSVGTVVVAFLLARDLIGTRPHRTISATFVAVAVAVAPVALVRQDLKQYTADAFVALVVLWLLVRLDAAWSPRRLLTLVIVAVVSSLVSYASMFVGAAVMVSLVVVSALRSDRQRLIQSLVAVGSTALAFLAVAWLFVVPHLSVGLRDFWRDFYLDGEAGLSALATSIWTRLDELAPLLGFRWGLLVGSLAAIGVVAMARRNHTAAALAVPLLWFEMVIMGLVGRYPFLDQRTSHFLLLLTIVVAGIGIESLLSSLSLRSTRVGAVFLLSAFSFVLWQSASFLESRAFPVDEVRAQSHYVAENMEPGDTVLVNALSGYGFSYYWPDQPLFFATDRFLTGFNVRFDRDDIFLANGRSPADIEHFFSAALRYASEEESSGRIWLVRYYMIESEVEAWNSVLDREDLTIQSLANGPGSLTLVTIDTK